MKLRKLLPGLPFLVALVGFCSSALSQQVTSYHAAMCQGNGKFHDDALKVSELGLINKLSDKNIWVTCPVPYPFTDNLLLQAYIGVAVTSLRNTPTKISCTLNGGDSDGNLVSLPGTVTVNPLDASFIEWELDDGRMIAPSIACKLPPLTGVFIYVTAFGVVDLATTTRQMISGIGTKLADYAD